MTWKALSIKTDCGVKKKKLKYRKGKKFLRTLKKKQYFTWGRKKKDNELFKTEKRRIKETVNSWVTRERECEKNTDRHFFMLLWLVNVLDQHSALRQKNKKKICKNVPAVCVGVVDYDI